MPPSLNELTLMVFNTGLTHLGSEASIHNFGKRLHHFEYVRFFSNDNAQDLTETPNSPIKIIGNAGSGYLWTIETFHH